VRPSILPVRALPGYARRAPCRPEFTIAVPTCQATWAGTIEIPAGPFIEGGPGEPPSELQLEVAETAQERVVDLPAFAIDRTEVTNAAYGMFASVATLTGVEAPIYVDAVRASAPREPSYPVTSVGWHDVRRTARSSASACRRRTSGRRPRGVAPACRTVAPNPHPRRNLPWGALRIVSTASRKLIGRGAVPGMSPSQVLRRRFIKTSHCWRVGAIGSGPSCDK
jgi:hypothetical protein